MPPRKQRTPRHPTRLNSIEVNSVLSYLTEIQKLGYTEKILWYRGIGDTAYKLTPSLFRHKTAKTKNELSKLELELNETFRMRSFPYTDSYKWRDDEWDQLFFMQHYRLPTRLLDWSGSPLVSLHFALTSARQDSNGTIASDAAVWVINPGAWNAAVYKGTSFSGDILSPSDSHLNRYAPKEVYESSTNIPPVAIRGVHNSPRIVAQQGFFTIFGPEKMSIEEFFEQRDSETDDYKFPIDCLVKFEIPRAHIEQMKNEMFSLGISESTIYPDLEGLSAELKRVYGF